MIDVNTFRGSTNLESIVLPNTLEKIDVGVFDGLVKLSIEELDLDNLVFLGNASFRGTKIRNVSNLGKITDSGIGVFENCAELEEFTFPNAITIIKNGYFKNCIILRKVAIPSSLKEVWDSAFERCVSLKSIVLPDGIASIRNGAFKGCTSLISITIQAITPPQLGPYSIFENTNNCPIYVPSSSVAAYKAASGWSNYASRIRAMVD